MAAHVLGAEHGHHAFVDVAVAVAIGVDGGVELVVTADRHQLQVLGIRRAVVLVQHVAGKEEVGLAVGCIPLSLTGTIGQAETSGLFDAGVVVGELFGQHRFDLVADERVVADQGVPVDMGMAFAQGRLGDAGDDGDLRQQLRRGRLQAASRAVHHGHGVLDSDGLHSAGLHISFGAAQAGQQEGAAAVQGVAPVEFGGDLYRQAQVGDMGCYPLDVGNGAEEVAAQADEGLGLVAQQGLAAFHHVMAALARRAEGEGLVEAGQEGLLGFLVDAYGAVALDVGMTPDRAGPRARLADVATQQQQIDDLLQDIATAAVLGHAHAPAGDHPVGLHVDLGRFPHGRLGQAGIAFQALPAQPSAVFGEGFQADAMLFDERHVEDAGGTTAARLVVSLDDDLAQPLHGRHIAADTHLVVLGADGHAPTRQGHVAHGLWRGEAHQGLFPQRIEGEDGHAAVHGVVQLAHHSRAVGAGILADDEDGVGLGEILQVQGALANADALRHGGGGGLVAHVGTVGKVVHAVEPAEQLVEKGGFVGGTA